MDMELRELLSQAASWAVVMNTQPGLAKVLAFVRWLVASPIHTSLFLMSIRPQDASGPLEGLPSPREMWLFTNRHCVIFDQYGRQMGSEQGAIDCYQVDRDKALRITQQCERFFIVAWNQWAHAITRKEMQYLLGLRTRDMDLAEQRQERAHG